VRRLALLIAHNNTHAGQTSVNLSKALEM